MMYVLASVAALTNDHTFIGLEQHKLSILQFCASDFHHESPWAKIKFVGEAMILSGGSVGESVSLTSAL